MNQLYALIEHHAGLYYNEDSPEIPDSEYDSLVRELSELEADYPQFARKDFLTHRVGGQVSKLFSPVKHEVPMLSLDNVFAPEELSNFFARIKQERDYVCEMKIDGLAVSLVYEDGVFVRGATRGDGSTGEDVTENLRMIESVPKELVNAPAGRVEVRGEVLMTWERFNVINRLCAERGEKVFANPRNVASGTLRQKNSQVVAERGLDIFLYYLVDAEAHGVRTQSAALEWMREHGLPIQEAYSYCETLEDVNAFIAAWQEKRHRLGYITDGVVVKLNDLTIWPKLGATSHAPRWAVAYKYPPEEARTRITGISVSVGRTGVLTPVAVLEPVSVGGSTVQRATLHNAKYTAEKDIRVGDVVFVRKAAEIIPEIVSVETGARTGDEQPFTMPESCPECGAAVTQRESAHVCTNMECPARLRESLRHFASRKGMDIRGLGKVLANELIDSGKVRTLTDIYRMTREDWLSVGLGDKGAQNIMNELEASKSRKLSAFITALGVPHVESTTAEILAGKFGSVEAIESASLKQVVRVLSPQVERDAKTVQDFFRKAGNVELLRQKFSELEASGKRPIGALTETLGEISGLNRSTRETLAGYFGSLEALSVAGLEEIAVALSPDVDTLMGIACSVSEFLAVGGNVERLRGTSGMTRKSLTEALCVIPGVERGVAQKLARHFGSLEALRAASPEEVATAISPNVGTLTGIAQSIHEFLADKENVARLSQSSGTTRKSLTEALCLIPGVERGVAQKLARHFGTLEALQAATPEEIFSVLDNVPELVIAESIHSFFHNEANIKLIDEFRELGLNLGQIQRKSELDGKIFVFTGALSTMTRSSAAKYVEALGAKFSNTITSATSYLVAGEKTGSKLNKAQKLGITILSEDEFLNLIHFDPQQSPEEIN